VATKKVNNLFQVSHELATKGDFDKALKVNSDAKKIALEKLGKESSVIGNCAQNRGLVYLLKQDYPEAEKWFLEAKTIYEKVLGKEHRNYAGILINLASLYYTISNNDKSEQLYLEIMTLLERLYGKEHSYYAQILSNQANLYLNMGNYERAEPLYLEANAIFGKVKGKEHPDYAKSLTNLALLYMEKGNNEKAESLYLESLTILEKKIGKENSSYASGLHNLALLYILMGIYEKAELLNLEAKAIREKVLGKDHPDYTSSIGSLVTVYFYMGNFEKAEPLNLEANAIYKKVLGKDHPDYARGLNNLANIYMNMNNYQKAEANYLEAKAIFEKSLSKEHPEYTNMLFNLGYLNQILGNYEKAELFFLETKSIREKVLGKEHPLYPECLSSLAELYEKQTRFLDAEPLIQEALNRSQATLVNARSFLSEEELSKYTATFQNSGDALNAYLITRLGSDAQTGILPSLAYDHALFYKGFLLSSVSRLNSSAQASIESTKINSRLKEYRRQLAAQFTMPIAERNGIPELEGKANIAEKELARSVAGYGDAIRQVKWQDVKGVLKTSESAIEFVHFQVNFPQETDSTLFAALVILPEMEQPKFIPLFEEKSLDSLLNSKSERKADYVNNLYTLADRGAVAVEAHKKSLYEILWKPLEKELTNVNTIYFSPSGLLHRINLDAIPINETETFADRFKLIELNSTRQLVIPTQIKNGNNDAVLYGGIEYEQDSMFQNNEPLMASRSRGELSFSNVDTTLRGGSWNYLAGTEREVNTIEKIMQTNAIQIKLKKGYDATEESFKNIGANNNPSPRILHIATHGYFFPDPKESHQSSVNSRQEETVFKISEHPMLRSGLIMAGGNAAWQGKQTLEGREDGILTAYEISQMNLSNTELVVLSACETGLGDIQGNEGVYGLQRAFKIAGAKYLIMSLWQVPDKQTSLLMTTFYKKWLEEKLSIPNAFHAAQKQLRDGGLEPYYWAGFVLVE
jgi:CHAT domain-containing protein/Flp pilus assembly protein TadD